jgi:hypothetical protein
MRSRSVRVLVGGCVLVGVCSGGVAWAALSGTSAGKQLARQMLASYKHVHWLHGSEHGDVHYCPSVAPGYSLGTSPPAGCGSKATVAWTQTLSNGKGMSAVGTVIAAGKPTITFVANRQGTFWKAASSLGSGANCWSKAGQDGTFVGGPPFGFYDVEYLTVGAHIGPNVLLHGTSRNGIPVNETDTINSHTHQMVGEDIHLHTMHPTFLLHLITSYHQVFKAPTVPATTPLC